MDITKLAMEKTSNSEQIIAYHQQAFQSFSQCLLQIQSVGMGVGSGMAAGVSLNMIKGYDIGKGVGINSINGNNLGMGVGIKTIMGMDINPSGGAS
jgi:hypothetical protein